MVPPPEFTHDANGTEWVEPAPSNPPPLRRRPRQGRPPSPASPPPEPPAPPSVWTDAKVAAVLQAVRSTFANLATKHGVPIQEVVSLVRDHLSDPDPG
jgi:hypothetical protein